MRQVILDTETTGLDPRQGHRLTEIGCIEMINRRETGKRFHTYVNPEREIDEGALRITGLTLDFLKDKPKFAEVADELLAFLQVSETELIIHNAPFDLGFINHELNKLNHPAVPIESTLGIIDTLILARRLHPGQKNNLDALCKRYNVDNSDREYHGALLDAKLLSQVYLAMTAGQTMMSLGADLGIATGTEVTIKHTKIVRKLDVPLMIIRADEVELEAHLKRLSAVRAKKLRSSPAEI
jgi:DNA polymerase III subunit epsilon